MHHSLETYQYLDWKARQSLYGASGHGRRHRLDGGGGTILNGGTSPKNRFLRRNSEYLVFLDFSIFPKYSGRSPGSNPNLGVGGFESQVGLRLI